MSRPKKEEKRSEILRIKLTKEEKDILRKESKSKETSMSQIIREALDEHYFRNIWCDSKRRTR